MDTASQSLYRDRVSVEANVLGANGYEKDIRY